MQRRMLTYLARKKNFINILDSIFDRYYWEVLKEKVLEPLLVKKSPNKKKGGFFRMNSILPADK